MKIQICVPQEEEVAVLLDETELKLNRKNKKICRRIESGTHRLQIRQINLLETPCRALNILQIILDLFCSIGENDESRKPEQCACSFCAEPSEPLTVSLHYGNHRKIEIVSEEPNRVKQEDSRRRNATQIERRWAITNVIAIVLVFAVAIVPCILISVSAFRPDTEALPAAKIFFPCLTACFTAMAAHTVYRRIRYDCR